MTLKRFKDLTSKEIRVLKYEDLESYIDLECAVEGIPLLPEYPKSIKIKTFQEQREVFYNVESIIFKDKKDAQEVIDLLNKKETFIEDSDYGLKNSWDYKYYRARKYANFSVVEIRLFSEKKLNEIKIEIKKGSDDKEINKELINSYDKTKEEREETENKIIKRWREEKKRERELLSISDYFDRYLKIANKDKKIAVNFLTDSYSGDKEVLNEFLKNNKLEEAKKEI